MLYKVVIAHLGSHNTQPDSRIIVKSHLKSGFKLRTMLTVEITLIALVKGTCGDYC